MGQVSLHGKHLLGLQHATPEEIKLILDVAKKMKKVVLSDDKKIPYLKVKPLLTYSWNQVHVHAVLLNLLVNILVPTLSILRPVVALWAKVKASATHY